MVIEPDVEEQDVEEGNLEAELGLEYEDNLESDEYWTWESIRQVFVYLLVIGYTVKFYLN